MQSTDYKAIVAQADELPDTAIIRDRVAAELLGISVWTLKRNNPVPPIKMSPRYTGRRMGDIRALGQAA